MHLVCNELAAAQQCVGADGIEVIGESSRLPAAAKLHRCAAHAPGGGSGLKSLVGRLIVSVLDHCDQMY